MLNMYEYGVFCVLLPVVYTSISQLPWHRHDFCNYLSPLSQCARVVVSHWDRFQHSVALNVNYER